METINRLTYKIDQYATGIEWGTPEDVKANLWHDLDNLRNNNNKNNLISDWKYKDAFESTERCHENGRKTFNLMDWQSSFAVGVLFMVYH